MPNGRIAPLKPCQPCQNRAKSTVWHGTISPFGDKPLIFLGLYGGDGGIRTLGTPYRVRRFSKPLPSATRPRLRQAAWIASRATLRNAELTPFVLTRHKSGM